MSFFFGFVVEGGVFFWQIRWGQGFGIKGEELVVFLYEIKQLEYHFTIS